MFRCGPNGGSRLFLENRQALPGVSRVRITGETPEEVAERIRKITEIAHQSAKLIAENPGGFSEEDLYDENGLPA